MDTIWVILIVLAVSVVVPLAALGWLVNGRAANRTLFLIRAAAVALIIAALYVANVWAFTSYYLRFGYVLLFALLAVGAWAGVRKHPWWSRMRGGDLASAGAAFALGAAAVLVLMGTWGAAQAPAGAVEVEFPFAEGTFYVAQGGSTQMQNAHMIAAENPANRGQTWGLDIVQMDPGGIRARGLYPADPARYRIFGAPVFSPCNGTVTASRNDLPDLTPPLRDHVNLAGNFVEIACDAGFILILGHLKRGSVTVAPGRRVFTRDRIGAIGNSGNTTEPHLHIHAQARRGKAGMLDAEPVPLVFRRYGWLSRNSVVRVR